MSEIRGIEYLRQKLDMRRTRVLLRYEQYNQKHQSSEIALTMPAYQRMKYRATLGWCAKAVDSLADRLVFKEFSNDNFEINDIFRLNNPDILFDSAILSALISSCCFIYITDDKDEEVPKLQVIDGANATGVLDPITGLLTEGYAVLSRDDYGQPKLEAYFLPYQTTYIEGKNTWTFKHEVPHPLLVPVIYRPDAKRPFGHSRISRACMYYQSYAKRTLERSDLAAEFYSFPQKYVVGLSQNAEAMDAWKATVSSMLQFTKDEDGDKPTLGQFTQQSMSPFTEQLRTAAAGFAAETGLTLDDLGFATDNPSSSEAIKASHETLRATARKAQRNFGSGFLNVGFLAACLRDDYAYSRSQFYLTQPKWLPVFEPDAAMLSQVGDGVIKLNQAVPGYVDKTFLDDLTGYSGAN